MARRALLISNNPDYLLNIAPKDIEVRYLDGSALDVLITARDLAHQGWILANHPLYGNFRPHQQPYRSLVMLEPSAQAPWETPEPQTPLSFLEEALMLYQSSARKSVPADLPEHMRQDCAMLDRELLKATIESLS